MRLFYSLLLSIALICLIGGCKYAEYSHLEGRVFTMVDGDTLFLDSVGVDFYNTEKVGGTSVGFGLSQDFHQRVWTTNGGSFHFLFKFTPAESIYELTFRKPGYLFDFQKFEISYEDLDKPIIRDQKLIAGEFKDLFYLRHQKEKADKKDVLFLSLVIVAIISAIIIILLMYGDRINIYIQDALRNRRRNKDD